MSDKLALDTVLLDCQVADKLAILEQLSQALTTGGYVREDYCQAVKERELVFPTGLELAGNLNVAIPHADSVYVNQPQIAFANLTQPVAFNSMTEPDKLIDVHLIFMLAIKDPNKQVVVLQKLMELFQKPQILEQIAACTNEEVVKQLLAEQLNEEEKTR